MGYISINPLLNQYTLIGAYLDPFTGSSYVVRAKSYMNTYNKKVLYVPFYYITIFDDKKTLHPA